MQRFFFSLILFNLMEMPVNRYTYKLPFLVLTLLMLGSFAIDTASLVPTEILRQTNKQTNKQTQKHVLQLLYQNVHLIENLVYRLFVELGISHDSETDSD